MQETPHSPETRIPDNQTPVEPSSGNTPQQTTLAEDEKQVSVLLTLTLPNSFDTSQWPVHMIIQSGMVGAGMWGGLNATIRMGSMDPGPASHVVALTFDDKDYPDWLPKVTSVDREIAPIMGAMVKTSLEGAGPELVVHAWPLSTERRDHG